MSETLDRIFGPCCCLAGYKAIPRIDPNCARCNYGDEVEAEIARLKSSRREVATEIRAAATLLHNMIMADREFDPDPLLATLFNAAKGLEGE